MKFPDVVYGPIKLSSDLDQRSVLIVQPVPRAIMETEDEQVTDARFSAEAKEAYDFIMRALPLGTRDELFTLLEPLMERRIEGRKEFENRLSQN